MPGTGKKSLYLLCTGFLLCGVLRVLLFRADFCSDLSQILCGVTALAWRISVRKRVTDRHLTRLLTSAVSFLMLFLVLQIARYSLLSFEATGSMTAKRLLWYAFYTPMTAVSVICYFIALRVHRPEDERLPAWQLWFPAAGFLLAAGVLTNDLHFCFKSFPDGILMDTGNEKSGWLYYAISAFICGMFLAALVILLKKSRRCRGQPFRWIPVLPMLAGLLYFLLYPLQIGPRLFGTRIWSWGEFLVFCLVIALETCIQTGLIPANTDYERLFPLAELSAAIVDSRGRLQYASGPAAWPFPERASLQIRRSPVPGGIVVWAVDVADLIRLNRETEETAQKLEARNAYLAEEARVKEERTEIETRNAIYDRITKVIEPQMQRIRDLTDRQDLSFDEKIRRITVIGTYIKRRSNMELLAAGGMLPAEELAMALLESTDSMRICGINAVSTARGQGDLPAEMVIAAYEQAENIAEDCLDTLSDFMVSIVLEGTKLTQRIMVTAENLNIPTMPEQPCGSCRQSMSAAKDRRDVLLSFIYTPGGEPA